MISCKCVLAYVKNDKCILKCIKWSSVGACGEMWGFMGDY
jgi:hypothetical protein